MLASNRASCPATIASIAGSELLLLVIDDVLHVAVASGLALQDLQDLIIETVAGAVLHILALRLGDELVALLVQVQGFLAQFLALGFELFEEDFLFLQTHLLHFRGQLVLLQGLQLYGAILNTIEEVVAGARAVASEIGGAIGGCRGG